MHAPASRRVASAATLLPQKSQAGHLPAYDIIADRGPEPRLTLVPFADFCMMHAKVAICHTHTHRQGHNKLLNWESTVTGGVDLVAG